MYKLAALNVLISSVATLFIVKTFPRSKVGWIVTIYAFMHLSGAHIFRMIYDYGGWTMDITTILMMVVCKLISFAFCYSDGEKIESLSPIVAKNAIKEFCILDYFSYIYFYPTCIMGPFFEFSDYISFVKEEHDFKNIPRIKCLVNGITRLLMAFTFAGVYLFIKTYISIDYYNDKSDNKLLPNWIIFCCFYFQKYRYISGFLFSESICVVSGLAYRKQIDHIKNTITEDFNRVRSINIKVTETSTSISKFFQNWNISVHSWLKKYVYFRITRREGNNTDKSRIMRAKIITFMVSGFWHGFYPSYYVVFSHFSMDLIKEENLEFIKKNMSKSRILNFAIDLMSSFIFLFGQCYLFGVQDSLEFYSALTFMSGLYFLPTIILVTVCIITGRIIREFKQKERKKEERQMIIEKEREKNYKLE
jgi:lysophospholipid acyltransferase